MLASTETSAFPRHASTNLRSTDARRDSFSNDNPDVLIGLQKKNSCLVRLKIKSNIFETNFFENNALKELSSLDAKSNIRRVGFALLHETRSGLNFLAVKVASTRAREDRTETRRRLAWRQFV